MQTDSFDQEKRQDQYISLVQGFQGTSDSFALDQENKNDVWKEVIKDEMTRAIEFQVIRTTPDGKPSP